MTNAQPPFTDVFRDFVELSARFAPNKGSLPGLENGGDMRPTKMLTMLVATALVASPASAAGLGPGAFVGAKVHLPFGKHSASKPRAALSLAPTNSRVSADGMVRTRVGEGLAFNLSPGTKPTLTIAGIRADRALEDDDKLGISTGGWIAIGVGTALIAGAVGFALWVDAIEDNED